MKTLSRILIFVFLVIAVQCKKDKEPENPPFDHLLAVESLVSINSLEIGGTNLKLVTTFDEKSPLSNGTFNTVVSKGGEQLLFITDEDEDVRALTLSTPLSTVPEIMKVDATSTAVSLVFLTPGILTTDASQANQVIRKIQVLNAFSPFKTYLKNNLKSSSLNKICSDTTYSNLLSNCVNEYSAKNISKGASSENELSEYKNYFTVNLKSATELELSNQAFRYVTVAQRDMNVSNNETAVKKISEQMGGSTPLSWGSLFTSSAFDPTINKVQYTTANNIAFSDIWVVGPGLKPVSEIPPQSIKAIEQPIVETLVAYVIFPVLDLVSGSVTMLTKPKDYAKFKEVVALVKVGKNTFGVSTATSKTALQRECLNLVISMIVPIASKLIPGVGTAMAIPGIIMGSANLGVFAAEIFKTEPYSKYKVISGTGPSTIPVLESPANNVQNISLPVILKWNSTGATSYSLQISRVADFSTKVDDETGITVTSKTVSALSNGLKYYWRVSSSNQSGTSGWSEVWNFTTSVALPVVTTATATSITYNSAIVGGEVLSDGGATITDRGVYYGEFTNPESTGTKVSLGSGTGAFTKTLTGLTSSKKYYVKAYAINSKGPSYGNLMNFTTSAGINLGKISGIIRDASTSSPIGGATVSVFLSSTLITSSTSLSDGSYEISVSANTGYRIIFGKTGYLDAEYQNIAVTTGYTTILEPVLQINSAYSGNGNIAGIVKNALTGSGIYNVTLKLRKGIYVSTGTVLATTTTSSTGAYSFSTIPGGNYTVEASLASYSTTYFNVISLGGLTVSNQDATMSPVLASGDTRIVLTWGASPVDLDSHLTGPLADGSRFHIYFSFKTIASIANLDLDDTNGYGPETTTIQSQISGVYRFSVHDYSNRGLSSSSALSNSGAQVKVYNSTGLVTTFNVPPNTGGTLWTVFELNGGSITPINQMGYSSSPAGITKGSYINPENELFINLPIK